MKKIFFVFLFFLIYIISTASSGGVTSVFDIGLGVKSQTLGTAYISAQDDSTGIYFNPAILDSLNKIEIQGAYIPLIFDTNYNYFVLGFPTVDYGGFAFSFARITTENIITRDEKGVETGKISQELNEIIAGWGKEFFVSNLSAGFNIKIDNQKIGQLNDSSVGMDIGFFYKLQNEINDKLNLGFSLKNILQPQIKLLSTEDKFPRQFRFGINYERIFNSFLKTSLYFETVFSPEIDFEHKEGIEIGIFDIIFLRAGFNSYDIKSVGAGINIFDTLYIDYGMFLIDIETQHRFSFKLRFGESTTVAKEQKQKQEMAKIEAKAKEIVSKELENMKKQIDEIKKKAAKDEYFKALHYTNALEAYNEGNLQLAEIEFEVVYTIDNNYLNIKYYYDMVKNMIKGKPEIYDKNIIQLYQKGVEKYLAGDYEGAKDEWTKILKIDPYNKLAIDNIKEVNEILRNKNSK